MFSMKNTNIFMFDQNTLFRCIIQKYVRKSIIDEIAC